MPLQQLDTLPHPRSSFGHVKIGTKIYIAGGHTGAYHVYEPESQFSNEVHVFDFTINHWAPLAAMPLRIQGFRMYNKGDYIYAFGGYTYDASAKYGTSYTAKTIATIQRYSITGDRWEVIGLMPRPRSSYHRHRAKSTVFHWWMGRHTTNAK
jgi:hypothetical protein